MYPENDTQFEDKTITKDTAESSGWAITQADGWCFSVPVDSPIVPQAGMTARFYGRGIGCTVRGLFLDGTQVFYRTKAEDREHYLISIYGKDATDWLNRWDSDKGVWSISMGGLGPGYEQAIQITVAEILRHLLEKQYDTTYWSADTVSWPRDRDAIEKAGLENPVIKQLGLSGSQWGAALNLALQFYRRGPAAVLTDEAVQDRKIQVDRKFPNPYV